MRDRKYYNIEPMNNKKTWNLNFPVEDVSFQRNEQISMEVNIPFGYPTIDYAAEEERIRQERRRVAAKRDAAAEWKRRIERMEKDAHNLANSLLDSEWSFGCDLPSFEEVFTGTSGHYFYTFHRVNEMYGLRCKYSWYKNWGELGNLVCDAVKIGFHLALKFDKPSLSLMHSPKNVEKWIERLQKIRKSELEELAVIEQQKKEAREGAERIRERYPWLST